MQPETNSTKKYALIIGGIVLFALMIFGLEKLASEEEVVSATATIISPSDTKIIGAENGAISLIEYSDFQCPACAAYHPIVTKLNEEFPNDLKIAYRYYPLTSIHKNAMISAQAAEAARKQGKFREMHDQLFDHQKEWGESKDAISMIREYANSIGLDMDQFEKDLNSDETKNAIEADKQLGDQARIQGTPTFFLNGKKVEGIQKYEDFKKLIDEAVSKK